MSDAPRAATPLKRRLLRGTAWVAASRFLGNGLSFALTLVLARLLTPEDFGVVALCAVIIGLLQQFYDAGVGEALVAIPSANERAQRTALSLALATSASVSLLTALSNPALGWLVGDARVGPAVAVLSLSLPFQSIGIVPRSLLRREFAMKKEGVGFVARSGAELIVAPSLALFGFGYWSLIIARLVGSVIECVALTIMRPWRFGFALDRAVLPEIGRLGTGLSASRILWQVYSQADFLLIGRILGATQLGYYSMAWNVARLPWDRLWEALNPLLLPTFSALGDDPARRGAVLIKLLRVTAAVTVPLCMLLALCAHPIVFWVLGERWLPAVAPMIALCFFGATRSLIVNLSPPLVASGDVRTLLRTNWWLACVLPGAFALAAWIGGTTWVAIVWATLYPALSTALMAPRACEVCSISLSDLMIAAFPALVSCALAAGSVFVLYESPLVTRVFTGVATYIGSLVTLFPSARADLRDVIAVAHREVRAGLGAAPTDKGASLS